MQKSRVLATKWLLSRWMCQEAKPLSNRQKFKAISPDRAVLNHLDNLSLGYLARRRERKAVAMKFDAHVPGAPTVGVKTNQNRENDTNISLPFPFKRGARGVQSIVTARGPASYPKFTAPEVALIGRSNVGKSTLLNALLGYDNSFVQRAKVSEKPGETRNLHFFALGATDAEPALVITDMPGYGFAYLSEEETQRVFSLSAHYLRQRGPVLKRVLLILDARHGIKITDIRCLNELLTEDKPSPVPRPGDPFITPVVEKKKMDKPLWKLQIVLTKCDLVERADIARRVQIIRDDMSEYFPGLASNLPIMLVSGHECKGIVELQKDLASLVVKTKKQSVEEVNSKSRTDS